MNKPKPPVFVLIMYALGQMGWSLAAYGVANLLIYYYMPPLNAQNEAVFPAYIYRGAVLGLGTVIGLLGALGRIFDAVTDPLIANLSDRSRAAFGKRRWFMAIGLIPFALFSILIFIPAVPYQSSLNAVWLMFCLFMLYLFMTIYVAPYTALISELGHTPNERLTISTYISITFALGYGLGTQTFAFQSWAQHAFALPPEHAFRMVMGAFALLAALLMALPVIFVDENKYCITHTNHQTPLQAIRSVLQNRNFRLFAISDLMYWLALTFIQMGIAYYISVLLGLEVQYSSQVLMGMLALSFVFYVPVVYTARKLGKKQLMTLAFAWFTLLYLLMAFLGYYPANPVAQIVLMGVFGSVPIAIFSILPNAVVADIIEDDALQTGQSKAAVFYAARAFMMKMGISLANLLFPSLLLLGNSAHNPMGVRVTAVTAAVFCLLGWYFFTLYKEPKPHTAA